MHMVSEQQYGQLGGRQQGKLCSLPWSSRPVVVCNAAAMDALQHAAGAACRIELFATVSASYDYIA
jgi:hypothetical protein